MKTIFRVKLKNHHFQSYQTLKNIKNILPQIKRILKGIIISKRIKSKIPNLIKVNEVPVSDL
jgi:hypothetical protein